MAGRLADRERSPCRAYGENSLARQPVSKGMRNEHVAPLLA